MIEEHVLTQAERRSRSLAMRRRGPMLKIKKEIASHRMAGEDTLERRARIEARDRFRVRAAGLRGKHYSELTAAEKIEIDRLIDNKSTAIHKLAKRLIPKIRKAERDRLAAAQNNHIQNGMSSGDHAIKECVDLAFNLVDLAVKAK